MKSGRWDGETRISIASASLSASWKQLWKVEEEKSWGTEALRRTQKYQWSLQIPAFDNLAYSTSSRILTPGVAGHT